MEAAFIDRTGYGIRSSDGMRGLVIEYSYELNPATEQNETGRNGSWKTKYQSGYSL